MPYPPTYTSYPILSYPVYIQGQLAPLNYFPPSYHIFPHGWYLDHRIIFLNLQGSAYTQFTCLPKGSLKGDLLCCHPPLVSDFVLHQALLLFNCICAYVHAPSSSLYIMYIDDIHMQLALTDKTFDRHNSSNDF